MTKQKHPSKWRFATVEESDLEGFEVIPGTDGYYRINRSGVIVSRRREALANWPGWWIKMKVQRLREERPINRVTIVRADGNIYQEHVGQLVLETFVAPRPTPNHHATHLNGNGIDDRVENLVWATPKERAHHASATGRTARGERHGNHKYSDRQRAAMVKIVQRGVPTNLLACAIGIPQGRLRELIRSSERMKTRVVLSAEEPDAGPTPPSQ